MWYVATITETEKKSAVGYPGGAKANPMMPRRDLRRSSGLAIAGSYSTSACSCVRLTATLSTPGTRPSAFSIVPGHNEQCSPPMRARILFRPGLGAGSSIQGWKCGVCSSRDGHDGLLSFCLKDEIIQSSRLEACRNAKPDRPKPKPDQQHPRPERQTF